MSDPIEPSPIDQNKALRESLERLTAEFAATQRLQEISIQMSRNGELDVLYEQILDAAVAIMESDFASLQMLDLARGAAGELGLLGSRGFSAEATRFWEWVRADSNSSCGMAFRTRQRCIVTDVEQCEFMPGTDDLAAYRQTGIRAVQTTPLLSRDGELVGMISTHWREPHAPSERDLRLFDLLARQAADLIEFGKSREQLRTLVKALRESDQRKDEFLATLSHELRNPLAPLRNALHVLRSAEADAAAAPVHEMMERQVNHLVRLVDDLLELSRINRGTFEPRKERVDVTAVVRYVIETSDYLIQAKDHHLDISLSEESVWVDGDPVRLAQVISNVINNATKYTDPGGRISLDVHRDADTALIVVRDNGAGIAPDRLEQVFEMFNRGDRGSAQDGLGIGLTLARRLVQMHGGTIIAYSDGPGQGSEFIVRLPLAAEQAAEAPSETPAKAAAAQQRVLVVDDNRDGADSLRYVLEMLGTDVRLARSGPEALEMIEAYNPEVVLLDIGMPGMDGYEVARRIRSMSGKPQPAIVALTGWGQPEDRRRSREAGCDHHLIKPADIGVLETLLRSLHQASTAPTAQ